jgi:zinc D-Ala-D-Ala dipeptidase
MPNVNWIASVLLCSTSCFALPSGFVYLQDMDPTILQDIRYAGDHNFIGRPIKGYLRATCILSKDAAIALTKVQEELIPYHLSLKVYDCYRPVVAVNDFIQWSQVSTDQKMKVEFFPHIKKEQLFTLGYIAAYSGHSRGSTLDLTLVDLAHPEQASYHIGQTLTHCCAPLSERFGDNSIDMGTGYDCMDPLAHAQHKINKQADAHRLLLQSLMIKHGFEPYDKEWWHFTLKDEPYPRTYFNFTVK